MQPIEHSLVGLTLRGIQSLAPSGLPIVAFHGWMDNAVSFIPLMQSLPHRAIESWDLAGHGHSDHRAVGARYHLMDYVLDTVELLRPRNEPCIVCGHSLGGAVAAFAVAALGADCPVKGLVLIDSLGSFPDAPDRTVPGLREASADWLQWCESVHAPPSAEPRGYRSFEQMVTARVNGRIPVPEEVAKLLCERSAEQLSNGRWGWRSDPRIRHHSGMRFTNDQILRLLSGVEVPTLAIVAENSFLVAVDGWLSRADAIVDKRIVHIQGGHHLHMETAALPAVATAVNDFVLAIEESME